MTVLVIAPAPPPSGGMALQARLLVRMLEADGVDVRFFASNQPLPRLLNNIPGLRTLARIPVVPGRLWQAVRDADLIHVFAASWLYFFLLVSPAVIISRIHGKRVVLNYRGGDAARFFRRFGWACDPILRLASVVVTPSTFLAQVIGARFSVPVSIVPNILNLQAFKHERRSCFRPKMLATRYLEAIYDVATIIRAARLVQDRYPEASLWIAGTGSEEDPLRKLAAELKLENVRFIGDVPHADMPALHAQCDILVNASRVDNFPAALLEASASGLAVVSTDAGGIPHVYENGVTALLVTPGDHEGLAKAVQAVVESPELGQRLTRAASLLATACDWNEVCKPLYEAYGLNRERESASTCVVPARS